MVNLSRVARALLTTKRAKGTGSDGTAIPPNATMTSTPTRRVESSSTRNGPRASAGRLAWKSIGRARSVAMRPIRTSRAMLPSSTQVINEFARKATSR
jgi:hypothetical protein